MKIARALFASSLNFGEHSQRLAGAALGILSLVISCLVWLVEGQQPTTSDMLGAVIAVIGALVIVGLAART